METESMEKMKMLLEQAVDQMMEEEEEEEERNDVVLVNHDGGDQDQHNRDLLLSKLISQLEKQRVEGKVDKSPGEGLTETSNKLVGPAAAPQIDHVLVEEAKSEIAKADEIGTEEIVKELKKVRRQNLITHCLLSVMIVITVAWQLSEVNLILKLKDGLSHPFRSLGSAVTGMLKAPIPPSTNGAQEGDNKQPAKQKLIEASSLPLKIPELPHVDLPIFDFDAEE